MGDNNLDPQTVQKLNENLDDLIDSLNDGTKKGDSLSKALANLQRKLNRSEETFDSLSNAVNKGRRSWGDLTESIIDLEEQLAKLKNTAKDSEEAKRKEVLQQKVAAAKAEATEDIKTKRFWDSTQAIVTGLASFAAGASKAVIGGYQSNASAFQVAGDVLNSGLDATNSTVKGFAGAVAAAAPGLAALGPEGLAAGAAIAAVSEGIISFWDKTTQTAKFVNNTLVKEMDNTIKSFSQATAAGALFAGGLQEMRDIATESFLTQQEFSKVIAENNVSFAEFGGSVSAGIKKFRDVNKSMTELQRGGLLNLGYSMEQIADGTADYMNILARTGSLQGQTSTELAAGTERYLTNLKAIADYTGEDVKKAKERAQAASEQLAVQAKLIKESTVNGVLDRKLLAENTQKFQNAVNTLGPGSERAVSQLYTLGTVTGQTAVAFGAVPAMGQKYADAVGLLNDKTVDASGVITRIQENGKKYSDAIIQQSAAAGQSLGIANQVGTTYAEATKAIEDNLQMAYKDQNVHKDTVKGANEAKNTQDDLTKSYREASIAFQGLKIQIQTELTGPMKVFGKVTVSVIKTLRELIASIPGMPGNDKAGQQSIDEYSSPMGETNYSWPLPTPPAGSTGASPGAAKTQSSNYGTLKFKNQAEATAGGLLDQKIRDAANLISSKYPGTVINGFNDEWHLQHKKPDDPHNQGLAADLNVPNLNQALVDQINVLISGLAKAAIHKNENAPGNHLHIEKSLENGAIAQATPGGTVVKVAEGGKSEAIMPLKNGKLLGMDELIDKMDDLIHVMKDQLDTSEKILHATA